MPTAILRAKVKKEFFGLEYKIKKFHRIASCLIFNKAFSFLKANIILINKKYK